MSPMCFRWIRGPHQPDPDDRWMFCLFLTLPVFIVCVACSPGLSPSAPDEMFEALQMESFSSPPELPDVMKPQDSSSTASEQTVQ